MVLTYFTDPNSLYYKFTEIYDLKLVSWIAPFLHYICILTILLTLILIFIVVFKTPKQMKFFKAYAIPFGFYTLCLEIVLLIFKPLLLHPFFVLVSLEMTQMATPKLLLIFFILTAYFAMSLIDCIMGMAAERYYAITQISLKHNKKPLIIFGTFSFLSFLFLLFSLICVCIDSIAYEFIMDLPEARKFLSIHLKDFESHFALQSILLFRTDIDLSNFIIGLTAFVIFVFSRYFIAIIFLCLIAWKSFSKNTVQMSPILAQQNLMLLRCTISQFLGFLFFAALPAFIILLLYFFVSTPSKIIYACFLSVNLFGLYGISMTVTCISPYRNLILNIFRFKFFKRKVSQGENVMIPLAPLPPPPSFSNSTSGERIHQR